MEFIRLVCTLLLFINVWRLHRCNKTCSLFNSNEYSSHKGSTMELEFSVPSSCVPENSVLKSIRVRDVTRSSGATEVFCQLFAEDTTVEQPCLQSWHPLSCYCDNSTGVYTVRVPLGKIGTKKMKVVCIFNGSDDKVQDNVTIHVSEPSEPGVPDVSTEPSDPTTQFVATALSVTALIIVIIIVVLLRRRRNFSKGVTNDTTEPRRGSNTNHVDEDDSSHDEFHNHKEKSASGDAGVHRSPTGVHRSPTGVHRSPSSSYGNISREEDTYNRAQYLTPVSRHNIEEDTCTYEPVYDRCMSTNATQKWQGKQL